MKTVTIGIIGGGLAGLTAAIHLALNGFEVTLFEKQNYPHHKVCGEYVSNEVLPYLKNLGVALSSLNPKHISKLQWTTHSGQSTSVALPLGGFGVSRYALDNLLFERAMSCGVKVIKDRVTQTYYKENSFGIVLQAGEHTNSYDYLIGAFGKRSNLDKSLNRDFLHKRTQWMAVKAHYNTDDFPDNLVQLHNFQGGYCGLSKVETEAVNMCYLTTYKSFQKHKDIEVFNEAVVSKNPYLKTFLSKSHMIFDKPLTIAQVSFEDKPSVEDHIFMIGDCAGLIHPLCGNGMAMAIHSAKIVSETLIQGVHNGWLRNDIEKHYQHIWHKTFSKRLKMGRMLQKILLNPLASKVAISSVGHSSWVLSQIIKATHGKPLSV